MNEPLTSGKASDLEDLPNLNFEDKFMLLNYFKSLPSHEKSIVTEITNLGNEVNLAGRKQLELLEKVDKLTKKYVSVFR